MRCEAKWIMDAHDFHQGLSFFFLFFFHYRLEQYVSAQCVGLFAVCGWMGAR